MFLRVGVEISYALLLAQVYGLCLCRPESKDRNHGEKATGNTKIYLIRFPRTLEVKAEAMLMHFIHTSVYRYSKVRHQQNS